MSIDLKARKPGALEMTPALKGSLKRLASSTYRRGNRNWFAAAKEPVSFHAVTELKLRNMIEIRHGVGRDRVTLTELGREIAKLPSRKPSDGEA